MKLFAVPSILIAMAFPLIVAPVTDDTKTAPTAAESRAPKFEGLGKHARAIETKNPEAQIYFNQGLAFLYAFNHDEAIRSFGQAVKLDPTCAMAYWGVAIANGGHINKPIIETERAKAASEAVAKAVECAKSIGAADRALIEALSRRYLFPLPKDLAALDLAYSQAMKAAWQAHPKDADIGALYAESLMNLRPWDLWKDDGQPHLETTEIVATLEAVMKLDPHHPLALHLYIHALEASPEPGKATEAADRLCDLQPGLGHMVHMPSHTYVRTGQWKKAIESNERAIRADDAYRPHSPKAGFYNLYMAHNHHMLAFAAMQRGESKRTLEAVRTMLKGVPLEWVMVKENAAIADGFLAAPYEVLIRFGKWDDLLKEPAPPEGFPIAKGLWLHARGVAYAAKGMVKEAREEQTKFREAVKTTPMEAHFANNKASDLFAVAEAMLEGEILFRENKLDDSIRSLSVAVKREDMLRYDEPPDWIVPVRHALGAFLLKAYRVPEAEEVYRADLKKWPNNGWSLRGLADALELQGKLNEAKTVREQANEAWKNADIKIHASCLCVPETSK